MSLDEENSVYVTGLPHRCTEETLRYAFDLYGAIVDTKSFVDMAMSEVDTSADDQSSDISVHANEQGCCLCYNGIKNELTSFTAQLYSELKQNKTCIGIR